MNFQNALELLYRTPRSHTFNVVSFTDREGVLVGLDSENRACAFIKSSDTNSFPSIRTDKLQVEFNRKYQLFVNQERSETDRFHSICCLSNNYSDTKTFVNIIDSVFSDPTTQLTADSLTSIFYSLASMFKITADSDARRARQGLWGELFFMKQFGGFAHLATTWHSDPTRLFDFSYENKRIEIKTTLRTERIHEFSHQQLFSLASEDIVIVSLLLREDDTGISLKSLIDEATTSLKGTPYFIRLEKAVIKAAMNNPHEEGPRYNEPEAQRNIAWFRAGEAPRFQTPEPEGVSSTHYRSDLTNAQRMSAEEIEQWLADWGNTQVSADDGQD